MIVESLNLQHLKPKKTLGDPKVKYLPNIAGKAPKEMHELYRSLIGSLLWASNNWRPGQSQSVNSLARFVANPSMEHLDGALEVLQYCLGTLRKGICFKKPLHEIPKPLKLTLLAWTDANWATDYDARSISGSIISIHFASEIEEVLKYPLKDRWKYWPKQNLIG